jgi:hypothetical protein
MRIWILALLLSGCSGLTTLTPDTTVDPQLTDATNIGLCLLRAANGDCSTPCPPSVAAATSCAYLTATATVTQDKQAIPQCVGAIVSSKALAYAQAGQVVLCSKPLFPVPPVVPLPTTAPVK